MKEAIAKLFKNLKTQKDQPRKAIWRNRLHDEPVNVTGELGRREGKMSYSIAESDAGIPEDELVFEQEARRSPWIEP